MSFANHFKSTQEKILSSNDGNVLQGNQLVGWRGGAEYQAVDKNEKFYSLAADGAFTLQDCLTENTQISLQGLLQYRDGNGNSRDQLMIEILDQAGLPLRLICVGFSYNTQTLANVGGTIQSGLPIIDLTMQNIPALWRGYFQDDQPIQIEMTYYQQTNNIFTLKGKMIVPTSNVAAQPGVISNFFIQGGIATDIGASIRFSITQAGIPPPNPPVMDSRFCEMVVINKNSGGV